ncbi:unnamed protein product [Mytilus coruscus]|uniref:UBZ1-type domain-containing protein n=1 Tax=Mytilus coruscus TaxID=42192 RepID=A0A6J8AK66_MYTCO|nr:unnamed protein product [Mytilus coruscus]
MTDKDEDIDIIDPSEGHHNLDSPPTFVIKSGTEENPQASHHALFQAYEDMKRRHQQVKSQNDILQQTIRDMEYSRQSTRNNSNMFGAAGPVGASPGADQDDQMAQVKAQIGYAESVQRQLMRAQAKIITLENENKDLKNKLQSLIYNKNNTGQNNLIESSQLLQKNTELNAKNIQLSEKINTLNRDILTFKQLLQERDIQLQQLEKQKDPNIMTEPFTRKIQELKTEMREKDEHISALMERLKTVSKGYEQKIMTISDREWPESGYNTRMNEDQTLLTVEESKQILFEIDKHKKTLKQFLQQLKIQTETIQKQGHIIQDLKRRAVSSNNVRVPADGTSATVCRDPASSWPSTSFVHNSPSKYRDNSVQFITGSGARPKDSTFAINNSRIFNEAVVSKANSSPVLSPSDDGNNTISQGDTLFGQGRSGVNNDFPKSYNYPVSVDNSSRNYMPSEVGSKFSPSILVSRQITDNSQSVYTPANDVGVKESTAVIESSHVTDANRPKLTAQVCPVCSRQFPNMPMEDFQQHVFECIDDGDDDPPQTLQNPTVGEDSNGVDRICPMCNKSFANTLPLADFEKHVQDHFNEESIVDRFEVLHP